MNKVKIISYIQVILIILIATLVIIHNKNKIYGFEDVYIYKLSSHSMYSMIIEDYETYKNIMKENNLKLELREQYFINNKLYVLVENNGICTDDDEKTITTTLCFDTKELKSYKYISCVDNCKKDDIIYMITLSKTTEISEGDLKVTEVKKFKVCD